MDRRGNDMLGDRYELRSQLGAGGMAEVWLGRDLVLGRTVAVKTLHTQYSGDQHFIERFRREAQHAAQLNHPNVVSVYDTGSSNGTYFIVMEYVEGKTLRDVIREEGPLLPERVAEIGAEVCAGLQFAHANGIIHRDVKPANIMITSAGAVKVADFGIARAASGDTVTQTAMVLGTAQYFSPEQAQSSPVDARSDVYSLGVVLYEMLTKQVPFTGSSPVAIAYKHVKEDPVPPSRLNADVPADLEAIVMKALAKNPDNRYQSAAEMREDLMRALHGRPVEAPPILSDQTSVVSMASDETVMLERGPRVKAPPTEEERRRRTGMVLLSVIVLAILAVAAWAVIGILAGSSRVKVPEVLGQPADVAQRRIEAVGLDFVIGDRIYSSRYGVGEVAEQDPAPETSVEEGSTVTVSISLGPQLVRVPDVVGQSQSEAERRIERAGLEVGQVTSAPSSDYPSGTVISQNPSGDTRIEKGKEVDLVVSSGPQTEEVPDVTGRLEDDAEAILEANGFKVQVVYVDQGPECLEDVGRVCRQDPEGGEEVEEGSRVTIFVAQEPIDETPQCSNGLDDDEDTLVDMDDPGCSSPDDDDESDG